MRQTIKIHDRDNVAIAVTPLNADICIGNGAEKVLTASQIPRGHKIALTKIEVGQPLIKYGFPIGRATQEIPAGNWVHTHNLETMLGDNVEYSYRPVTTDRFGPNARATRS
jgi:altronate hydrolase